MAKSKKKIKPTKGKMEGKPGKGTQIGGFADGPNAVTWDGPEDSPQTPEEIEARLQEIQEREAEHQEWQAKRQANWSKADAHLEAATVALEAAVDTGKPVAEIDRCIRLAQVNADLAKVYERRAMR